MTAAAATASIVEKAAMGGYAYKRLTFNQDGTIAQIETLAFRSSLVEISELQHSEHAELFGEAAWHRPQVPTVQPSFQLQRPPPAPMPRPEFDVTQYEGAQPDTDMPGIVRDQQSPLQDPTLVDKIRKAAWGNGSHALALVFGAAVWCSMNLPRLMA
jgi:hypothetical protein